MDRADRKHFDRIKLWLNRANDAWAMGEADWLRDGGLNVLAGIVEAGLRANNDIKDIADNVEQAARAAGIDPKRHKLHGIR